MENKERFSQKHIILFSLIVGLIFVVIFGLGIFKLIFNILATLIMPSVFTIPAIDYLLTSINNLIAFGFLILVIKHIGLFENIPWNFKGVSRGLIIGSTLILFTIIQMLLIFLSAPDKTIVIGLVPIINTIIYCISIGLWEETLCRGLLLTNMLKKWGNTKKGIGIAIVLSAIIFGGLHLISITPVVLSVLLGGMDLITAFFSIIPSLIQVMYASVMGIMLAVIYIKTKSLWSAIVLHIILNFAAYSMPYIMPYSAGINQGFFLILLILFNALWIIISYFVILKMDVSEVEELLTFNK